MTSFHINLYTVFLLSILYGLTNCVSRSVEASNVKIIGIQPNGQSVYIYDEDFQNETPFMVSRGANVRFRSFIHSPGSSDETLLACFQDAGAANAYNLAYFNTDGTMAGSRIITNQADDTIFACGENVYKPGDSTHLYVHRGGLTSRVYIIDLTSGATVKTAPIGAPCAGRSTSGFFYNPSSQHWFVGCDLFLAEYSDGIFDGEDAIRSWYYPHRSRFREPFVLGDKIYAIDAHNTGSGFFTVVDPSTNERRNFLNEKHCSYLMVNSDGKLICYSTTDLTFYLYDDNFKLDENATRATTLPTEVLYNVRRYLLSGSKYYRCGRDGLCPTATAPVVSLNLDYADENIKDEIILVGNLGESERLLWKFDFGDDLEGMRDEIIPEEIMPYFGGRIVDTWTFMGDGRIIAAIYMTTPNMRFICVLDKFGVNVQHIYTEPVYNTGYCVNLIVDKKKNYLYCTTSSTTTPTIREFDLSDFSLIRTYPAQGPGGRSDSKIAYDQQTDRYYLGAGPYLEEYISLSDPPVTENYFYYSEFGRSLRVDNGKLYTIETRYHHPYRLSNLAIFDLETKRKKSYFVADCNLFVYSPNEQLICYSNNRRTFYYIGPDFEVKKYGNYYRDHLTDLNYVYRTKHGLFQCNMSFCETGVENEFFEISSRKIGEVYPPQTKNSETGLKILAVTKNHGLRMFDSSFQLIENRFKYTNPNNRALDFIPTSTGEILVCGSGENLLYETDMNGYISRSYKRSTDHYNFSCNTFVYRENVDLEDLENVFLHTLSTHYQFVYELNLKSFVSTDRFSLNGNPCGSRSNIQILQYSGNGKYYLKCYDYIAEYSDIMSQPDRVLWFPNSYFKDLGITENKLFTLMYKHYYDRTYIVTFDLDDPELKRSNMFIKGRCDSLRYHPNGNELVCFDNINAEWRIFNKKFKFLRSIPTNFLELDADQISRFEFIEEIVDENGISSFYRCGFGGECPQGGNYGPGIISTIQLIILITGSVACAVLAFVVVFVIGVPVCLCDVCLKKKVQYDQLDATNEKKRGKKETLEEEEDEKEDKGVEVVVQIDEVKSDEEEEEDEGETKKIPPVNKLPRLPKSPTKDGDGEKEEKEEEEKEETEEEEEKVEEEKEEDEKAEESEDEKAEEKEEDEKAEEREDEEAEKSEDEKDEEEKEDESEDEKEEEKEESEDEKDEEEKEDQSEEEKEEEKEESEKEDEKEESEEEKDEDEKDDQSEDEKEDEKEESEEEKDEEKEEEKEEEDE